MNNLNHKASQVTIALLACLLIVGTSASGRFAFADNPGQPAQPLVQVGSGFTYQGQLKDGGVAANGQYDLQFSLYDDETAGNQIGSTVQVLNHTVIDGLFTVQLDFGASAFQGQGRWLEIAVQPAGGGSYTTLTPRQPLTAAPYAASLMPGATVNGSISGNPVLVVTNTTGIGVQGTSSSGTAFGVYGRNTHPLGYGVYGVNNTNSSQARGVVGVSNVGIGVSGVSTSQIGVHGGSNDQHGGLFTNNSTIGYAALQGIAYGTPGYGIYGEGNSIGVWGSTANGTGVRGATASGYGVHGYNVGGPGAGGAGVRGEGGLYGVHGLDPGGTGVMGEGDTGVKAYGQSYGVYGQSVTGGGRGVYGSGDPGVEGAGGVFGWDTTVGSVGVQGSGYYGVRGDGSAYGVWGVGVLSGLAGYFNGNVHVTNNLSKGGGSFKIDHPLDPENKYLYHSFVESPDMMNIYNGNVMLDAKGEAVVTMPLWFEALNMEFRYQLTAIGAPGPNLYVAQEIQDNRFKIAGGKPSSKVSWQVTGVRQDAYAQAHRIVVEEPKPAGEKGKYLHPVEHGQPESKGVDYERIQQSGRQPQQPPKLPEQQPTTGR